MKNSDKTLIYMTICMGSSCYARGNDSNLETIETYLEEHSLDAKVELSGSRCEGNCAKGPNLTVNGKRFSCVDREMLLEILKDYCEEVPHG